jgi:pimeloyl-ACP methyl ester carboxylesterase
MRELGLGTHPDAVPGAAPANVVRLAVNGTTLHAEVRGSGPAILLIPAGGEDAEWWRGVAERLSGFAVITYDRRGTGRSGREDWPGKGSVQHADDAASLLADLGYRDAVVFGNSSAGVVGLQLALRHPHLIRRALLFEPGYLRQVPGGDELHARMRAAVAIHLEAHPDDWAGAAVAVGRSLVSDPAPGSAGLFAAPPGKEWYMTRGAANAEPLIRDDVPILSHEIADEADLAASGVDIRFAFGSRTAPIFQAIAVHLAAVRRHVPDVIEGVTHSIHYQPDEAAAYIKAAAA